MSSSDRFRTDASAVLGASPPVNGSAGPNQGEPYASWLERMQRSRTRHAAISKNLYTWSNYKNWADQVKHSFEDDEGSKK